MCHFFRGENKKERKKRKNKELKIGSEFDDKPSFAAA